MHNYLDKRELSDYEYIPETFNENIGDLIHKLASLPNWMPLKYATNGIYDAVLENFIASKNEELTENEEYQWVRIQMPSNIHSVRLARPNKKVEVKTLITESYRTTRALTNVVRLDVYFYRSAVYPDVQAFTFGDTKNLIKPIKKLNHAWKKSLYDQKNKGYIALGNDYSRTIYNDSIRKMGGREIIYACETCKLKGIASSTQEKAIFPEKMMTCDEVMIKDILI